MHTRVLLTLLSRWNRGKRTVATRRYRFQYKLDEFVKTDIKVIRATIGLTDRKRNFFPVGCPVDRTIISLIIFNRGFFFALNYFRFVNAYEIINKIINIKAAPSRVKSL